MSKNLSDKIDYVIVGMFFLLSLSCCISEAMARNCTRILLVLSIVRCIIEPGILKKLIFIKYILGSILLFFMVMLVSAVYGGHFYEVISENMFWYQYSVLLLPICLLCIKSSGHIRLFLYSIFFSMLITDVYIFYQTYHGEFRPSALLMSGVITATVLKVTVLPAMLTMIFAKGISILERGALAFASCISVAGLICLNTRGGWLAFFPVALVIIMYLISGWKRKIAVLSLCCLTGGVILFSFPSVCTRVDSIIHNESQQSAVERKLMWKSAYQMGMDHPVLGVGKGNYESEYQHEYISIFAKEPDVGHAHSNFLQMFGENGFLGLLSYCSMIIVFLLWGWKYKDNIFGIIILGTTAAFTLYGVTDYTLANYGGMRVYWLMMGLSITAVYLDE